MSTGTDWGRWCVDFLAPWNEHDPDAAVRYFTEDAVWEFTVGPAPAGQAHVGKDAIRKAIAGQCELIPDLHYELVHHYAGPDHVAMEVLVTGTTKDGQQLNYRACDVIALQGGLVAAKRSYRKVVS